MGHHTERWRVLLKGSLAAPLQPDVGPKAAPVQTVARLFLGGLAVGGPDFGREGPQSPEGHLESSEGGRLSRAAHDSPMR